MELLYLKIKLENSNIVETFFIQKRKKKNQSKT